jgi:hypothetical protein
MPCTQQQDIADALIAVRDAVTVQRHDLEIRGGIAVGGIRVRITPGQ